MTATATAPLFPLGQCLITPGALEALADARVGSRSLLGRHQSGDWGVVDDHDRGVNDWAVCNDARLLSAYDLPTGERVWIITEADRASTTILLPDEY